MDTPITVTCTNCGNAWQTTGKYKSRVKCPACGTGRNIGRSDRPLDSEPEGWSDETEPETAGTGQGQETGWDCRVCGEPAFWLGARAGISCPNGHSAPSPDAADRAELQQASSERARRLNQPEPEAKRGTAERKAEYEFEVTKAKTILPLAQMRDSFSGMARIPDFHYATGCMEAAINVQALIRQLEQTNDMQELLTVRREFQPELTSIESTHRNIANVVERERIAIDQKEQRERLAIESGQSKTYQATQNEYEVSDETASHSGKYRYDDDSDDDYDDSEYPTGFKPNANFPWTGFLIVCGIVGAGILINKGYNNYMDAVVPVLCEGPHNFKRPLATRQFVPCNNYNVPLNNDDGKFSCGRDKCDEKATQAILATGNKFPRFTEVPEGWHETRRNRRDRNTVAYTPPGYAA